ncbi:MAG: anthranilate synthase component I [Candidatus Omnitrophica bacterium]|nr:anthranilate synthase component I [Candidatus Omnitrophota bacterium]MBI3010809.1 anthranilate synthase component I [Candidatus Omnitrophota bacterium]
MKIVPSEKEFLKMSKKGNVIPVYGQMQADLETPVSAFLKLDDGRFSYLLESVEGAEKVARYSFLGSQPQVVISGSGRHVEFTEFKEGQSVHVRRVETLKDPLKEIERFMSQFRFVPVQGLPRFCGGLVGFLGYNVVQYLERLPRHAVDDLRVPDLMFMLTDTMVIFDHAQHSLFLVANASVSKKNPVAAYRKSVQSIEQMSQRLKGNLSEKKRHVSRSAGKVHFSTTQKDFFEMVRKTKSYIRSGDIIQAVLSQRMERSISCQPLDVYRCLRSLNPSPYMFLLRFDGLSLVGASPEMLVRCEQGRLETRPIAGTRPRGKDEREEEKLITQLRTSPKEKAEHLMLVDLGRNDLGRVAQIGSVQTAELMVVEKYSHVLHLVSSVTARLQHGKNAFDVLRATFPAGTVTGAPKVRAMEIIAQLESHDRGPYAGAVGYISFSGNLDTCITIRTVLIQDNRAYIQAGAGIVADSQPAREYQETLSKAKAMLQALEVAEHGMNTQ